ATDDAGKEVVDPHPVITDFGGLGGEHTVEPGKKYYDSVQLHRYRRLEKSGTYKISVWHDLGWKETKDQKIPSAEIKLKLVMPSAKEAAKVVEAMYQLTERDSIAPGAKSKPFPDFAVFQQAVYLPIFAPRAKDGCKKALKAIGSIADPEATKTLLELISHK